MCRQQINRPTDLPSYEGNNDGSKEFQRNSHLKRKDSGRQSLNSDRFDPRIKEKGDGKGYRQRDNREKTWQEEAGRSKP